MQSNSLNFIKGGSARDHTEYTNCSLINWTYLSRYSVDNVFVQQKQVGLTLSINPTC